MYELIIIWFTDVILYELCYKLIYEMYMYVLEYKEDRLCCTETVPVFFEI